MATPNTNPDTADSGKESPRHVLSSIYVVRQCIVVLLWRLFVAKIFFWVLGSLLHVLPQLWPTWQNFSGEVSPVWIHSILFLLEAFWFGYVVLRWYAHYYLITPDKIISHKGVITKRQEVCGIKNIESINLHQSVLGRIFSFGTLKLYAPTLNHRLNMVNIHRPQKKMHIIEHLLPNTSSRVTRSDRTLLIVPGNRGRYAAP